MVNVSNNRHVPDVVLFVHDPTDLGKEVKLVSNTVTGLLGPKILGADWFEEGAKKYKRY